MSECGGRYEGLFQCCAASESLLVVGLMCSRKVGEVEGGCKFQMSDFIVVSLSPGGRYTGHKCEHGYTDLHSHARVTSHAL